MAISLVQFKHVYPATTVTFTSNVTRGNLILVVISGDRGTSTDSTCSDNLGNTYTKAYQIFLQKPGDPIRGTNMALWYSGNCIGGACTVTATVGTGDRGITLCEYTSTLGAFFTSPLMVQNATGSVQNGSNLIKTTINSPYNGLLFATWANEYDATETILSWSLNLKEIQHDYGHLDAQAHNMTASAGFYNEGLIINLANSLGDSVIGLSSFREPTARFFF